MLRETAAMNRRPRPRHPHSAFAAACLLCFLRCAAAQDSAEEGIAQLDRLWAKIEKPGPNLAARDLFSFALEATALGYGPDRVEKALERAEQMQDRNPNSPTFGNFRWSWGHEKPMDRNAVEFSMQRGALLPMLFKDKLTGQAQERLERLIEFSVEGIRRHPVAESYTNIYLMKMWNCIALGENTGRPDLADEGYAMLDAWLLHAWDSGIHEYLSPTYYGVDLDSLGLMAKLVKREPARKQAEAILRLFWTDIAANWFAPCQRLGGAHSRDYDYLTGHGGLDRHLQRAGWIDTAKPPALHAFEDLAAWAPPADLRPSIGAEEPRTIHQRWGLAPWETATHCVGRRFSIGSAGACYGSMDKPLTVNLAGGPAMPMVNVFMEARGDPYGKRKDLVGGGHYKALHLTPFLMSVQRGTEVLLLASADPAVKGFAPDLADPVCLLTHVVIPARAEIWTGEDSTAPTVLDRRLALSTGEAVFLRFEDVAVGIRFPLALDTAGQPASIELVGDGLAYDAARLTCVHSASKPQGRGAAAVWIRASEGLDPAGFDSFRRAFSQAAAQTTVESDTVDVRVSGTSGQLRLAADLAKGQRLACQGGDPGAEDRLLAVNGRDFGREILGDLAPVRRCQSLLAAALEGGPGAAQAEEVVQAEDAALIVPPFRIAEDPAAQGGKFVWAPGKAGEKGGSPGARALWVFHIAKAGPHYLWGRVQAPTPSDDSFFVSVKQDSRDALPRTEWPTGVHPKWEWTALRREPGKPDPAPIDLSPGTAFVELRCREDGTQIDGLFLSADANARPVSAPSP